MIDAGTEHINISYRHAEQNEREALCVRPWKVCFSARDGCLNHPKFETGDLPARELQMYLYILHGEFPV
jgi:hypothetical protein